MSTPKKSKPRSQAPGNSDTGPQVDETAVPPQTPKTDEELLDQSLVETFPASDPISPGAGITKVPGPRRSKA